jgi:copper transport protein
VFLHTVAVAFWIGSLIPLALLLWRPSRAGKIALVRFSRAIPFAIAPLVLAGVLLTLVQFDSISDFWTTDYGRILAVKLALVAALFALAAANRFFFTDRAVRGDAAGTIALRRSVAVEVGLVVMILALVGLWRFTPPPRTVAAVLAALSAPAVTHVMTPAAMVAVTVTPGRAGPVQLSLNLTDLSEKPLVAKEVSVDLANPDAGIEPITKAAVLAADGSWHIDSLTLPIGGIWRITVNALITDFSEANLEGSLVIHR